MYLSGKTSNTGRVLGICSSAVVRQEAVLTGVGFLQCNLKVEE